MQRPTTSSRKASFLSIYQCMKRNVSGHKSIEYVFLEQLANLSRVQVSASPPCEQFCFVCPELFSAWPTRARFSGVLVGSGVGGMLHCGPSDHQSSMVVPLLARHPMCPRLRNNCELADTPPSSIAPTPRWVVTISVMTKPVAHPATQGNRTLF